MLFVVFMESVYSSMEITFAFVIVATTAATVTAVAAVVVPVKIQTDYNLHSVCMCFRSCSSA